MARVIHRLPVLRSASVLLTVVAVLVLAACGTESYQPLGQTGVEPHDPPASPKTSAIPRFNGPQQGPCTKAGTSVAIGAVDAALGHRALGIALRNCSRKPVVVSGYPTVRVLDAQRRALPVRVEHGSSYMGRDSGPKRITLAPGKRLVSLISWSATVTDGKLADGEFVAIEPTRGDPPTTFGVWLDLGTTAEVSLIAWSTHYLN